MEGEWSTSCPGSFYTSRKEQHYSSKRKLVGSQSWFGHFGEEKNLLPLLGIELWIVLPVG
jgi:hypothetical protein